MKEVVILEDESLMNDLLALYCEALEGPVHVRRFINPLEALKFVDYKEVDLVILDILLPQMNAHEFLQNVHKNTDGVMPPILTITAIANDQMIKQIQDNFPVTFLRKPFRKQAFLSMANKLLKEPKGEVESETVYKQAKKA